ncbi:hypothetical protein AB5J56_06430 [Streptomyces sp. R21]|uniref:Uncharacterized protein n=1 Tax=Streptomyces sp. R21 TaxID=3238627 RepID=A0AB39P111_9ACTN
MDGRRDLLKSPPTLKVAQGVGFMTSYAPVENTEATRIWPAMLKKYAKSASGIPSFSQAVG